MTEENLDALADAESATLASAVEESLRKEKARRFRKGDRVKGRVARFTDSMAFVDLENGRGEGMLDLARLRRDDGTLELEENEIIEAIVIDVAANGLMLEKALITESESLEQLAAAQAAGLPVQATVVGYNKGGLELELFGVRGFCPSSQVDLNRVDDLSAYVGESYQFRIQEIDGRKAILSRRALLLEAREEKRAAVRSSLKVGATVTGTVARLQPFGAFVDLGEGIEGLIHLTELSRTRVHDASQVVSVGDEVQVQILEIKESTDKAGKPVERIALSRKALEKDPWADAAERFPVGSKVSGKVVRLQPFGAFIEVADGVDGLAHVSTLAPKRIEHPSEVLKAGDSVEAFVLAVEPEKQRLSLSLMDPAAKREARPARGERGERGERPERGDRQTRRPRAERASRSDSGGSDVRVGSVHDATVEKVEPFGVFVALPTGERALVPNRELGVAHNRDTKPDYRKLFSPGDTLRVAVIDVRRGELKASKIEAEYADERALMREWTKGQKPAGGGKSGFGTLGDLLKNVRLDK